MTDTSGRGGTVALARAGESDRQDVKVIEVAALAGGMFSAQLVPQIAALLQKHQFSKSDIDGFVVVSGPGSFTGLRVGLAAIKALAEILRKPIAAVSLLELVAKASRLQGKVVAVLDGGRGEVFFGAYSIAGESMQVLREELLSKAEFLSQARDSTVATPDLTLAEMARDTALTVAAVEQPSAATIARLGWEQIQAGKTVSPERLEANYMRRSDADMYVKVSS
ncbi:MAG TPA: tRNA (adenosine(37)-N6)-threonylcarbamoyltransferase complex dimerization subunit type 1 TsaB [Candidatus Sulfotelmatobacter sp.]